MTVQLTSPLPPSFVLPPDSEAHEPPERRGLARDEVRLLVAGAGTGVQHTRFRHLADHLTPGDLVVINTSATLPAAVDGARRNGVRTPVHLAGRLDDGSWVIEVRRPDNTGPALDVRRGEPIELTGGVVVTAQAPYPSEQTASGRLWRAMTTPDVSLLDYLYDFGRPIRYGYLSGRWPLRDLQTVYADEPGSAEMPSAGRPFSARLIVRLVSQGVTIAPIVLHTGVSSPEKHEPPMPERFRVPAPTARLVNDTRRGGGRIVAVGTTVVRALESATDAAGTVAPAYCWTDLVVGPHRPARVVDGLITGLHEPEASHLLLLEAVAGRELVRIAYEAAVEKRYLWHEFGDSMLFLPPVLG